MAIDGELPVRTDGGTRDQGPPQHTADVADEVARGSVVGGVHNHVIPLGQLQGVRGQKALCVRNHLRQQWSLEGGLTFVGRWQTRSHKI